MDDLIFKCKNSRKPMRTNDDFILKIKRSSFHILVIYIILIFISILGNISFKRDRLEFLINQGLITDIFIAKKLDCNIFLLYFDDYKVDNKNTITHILKNINLVKSKDEDILPQFKKNLHIYLKKTLDYKYETSKRNTDFIYCLSENEILYYRMWKNSTPSEYQMFSWKDK